MIIKTKYFGELSIEDENILHFQSGLPAFEKEKTFILLSFGGKDKDSPFAVLQSTTSIKLAFIVVDIFHFFPEYETQLPLPFIKQLELTASEDASLWGLVTMQGSFAHATVNLAAPLVFNLEKRLAKQLMLPNSVYARKQPLFEQAGSEEASICSY